MKKKTKPLIGRPTKYGAAMPPRTIRVDTERWTRWQKAAKKSGKSLNEWLRDAGDAAAR